MGDDKFVSHLEGKNVLQELIIVFFCFTQVSATTASTFTSVTTQQSTAITYETSSSQQSTPLTTRETITTPAGNETGRTSSSQTTRKTTKGSKEHTSSTKIAREGENTSIYCIMIWGVCFWFHGIAISFFLLFIVFLCVYILMFIRRKNPSEFL